MFDRAIVSLNSGRRSIWKSARMTPRRDTTQTNHRRQSLARTQEHPWRLRTIEINKIKKIYWKSIVLTCESWSTHLLSIFRWLAQIPMQLDTVWQTFFTEKLSQEASLKSIPMWNLLTMIAWNFLEDLQWSFKIWIIGCLDTGLLWLKSFQQIRLSPSAPRDYKLVWKPKFELQTLQLLKQIRED